MFITYYYFAILGRTNNRRLAMTRLNNYRALLIILLVAIIATGGIISWSRYSPSRPIEISLPPPPELQSEVYVGGAVNNPGLYPSKSGESIEHIIQAAGGTTSSADLSQLKVYIPGVEEEQLPQKIDINRAEAWLLEALPGIGEVRAQAIIDYRRQNEPFHNISELTKVKGISLTTFEQIKHLITIAD
jgi:competence protein ComEA